VTETLAPWHDFYTLVGGAAATLIGLLFVAISVTSATLNSSTASTRRWQVLRVYFSPSVVHLASVLATSLIMLAPIRRPSLLGAMIGLVGGCGLAYAAIIWRGMIRSGLWATVGTEDRILYAAQPTVGHALVLAAAAALADGLAAGCATVAFAIALLLLTAIRNAWDITVWLLIRRES
jgi:hypothetical protein